MRRERNVRHKVEEEPSVPINARFDRLVVVVGSLDAKCQIVIQEVEVEEFREQNDGFEEIVRNLGYDGVGIARGKQRVH